jgi:hypothetical protein
MPINMHGLELMLPVDVRVQIKAPEPRGWVSCPAVNVSCRIRVHHPDPSRTCIPTIP